MIKKIAWDTFKNTGDIHTFLELKQIELIQNNMQEIQEIGRGKEEITGTFYQMEQEEKNEK